MLVEVSTPSFHTYADVVVIVINGLLFKNVKHRQDARELLINLLTAMREADTKQLDEQKPSLYKKFLKVRTDNK